MIRAKYRLALSLATCLGAASVHAADTAQTPLASIAPQLQTVPSQHDAAKDVAIWLHPTAPAQSLVLGAGGTAGLEVYSLQGQLLQRVASPEADLVDVRYAVSLGDATTDVAFVLDAPAARLHVLTIDPGTRELAETATAAPLSIATEATGMCTYRSDVTGKLYVLVSTDEGDVQQWEFSARSGRFTGTLVRRIPVGRGVGQCVADDASAQIFVAVETTGLWRIAAEPESDATPVQLDAIAPLGSLAEEIKGLALYRASDEAAYLLTLDVGAEALKVYGLDGARHGAFKIGGSESMPAVAEPEGLAFVAGSLPGFAGGVLAVNDEDNDGAFANYKLLAWQDVAAALGLQSRAAPSREVAAAKAITVAPAVETEPVTTFGDAADDPAVWVHPDDPAQSLIIGTNKESGLEVYTLDGKRVQQLPDGRMNNVDIRYGFPYRGERVAIVVASNRTNKTIAVYKVDKATRRLAKLDTGDMSTQLDDPYGLCLYKSARDGRFYVFINDADSGLLRQWRLEERRGRVELKVVRDIEVGSQSEGCVAHDATGNVYVGEEDVAIWKYGAEPGAGSARKNVDNMKSGRLTADVEGLGVFSGPDGTGYLVASNQGADNYVVYRLEGDNEYVGTFHVVANNELGIDGASETDGLDVTSTPLGPAFPSGALIVQDGRNLTPTDRQNFKIVPWERIAEALKLQP